VRPFVFANAIILRELNSQSLQIHAEQVEQYLTSFIVESFRVSLQTSQIPIVQPLFMFVFRPFHRSIFEKRETSRVNLKFELKSLLFVGKGNGQGLACWICIYDNLGRSCPGLDCFNIDSLLSHS
jgi:hypothetical protein